jgi:hypothetical protein
VEIFDTVDNSVAERSRSVDIMDTVDNSVAERSRSVDIMDTVDKATKATTASSIVNFLQIKI